ncbi:MAG: tRNA pseudouridine(55) synthase TruB [Myxococcota bacterium]
MDGLLLVDKPVGLTSFDVVKRVRRLLDISKVGHTGTLDPRASGLLPIVVGRCTKLAKYLSSDRKAYEFGLELGKFTETLDSEGEVSHTCEWEHVTEAQIESALELFRGEVQQIPPKYSAIKINGERAYELARSGKDVEMKPRQVVIHDLQLVSFEPPHAKLRVECGSGTYVRSLVRDIAVEVGSCAFTTSIHRTAVGPFELDRAVALDELSAETAPSAVLSPAMMMRELPSYVASHDESLAIGYGQKPFVEMDYEVEAGDAITVLDEDGELVAVATIRVSDEGATQIKPDRVLKPQNNG